MAGWQSPVVFCIKDGDFSGCVSERLKVFSAGWDGISLECMGSEHGCAG
jgi:hypothetical protein